MLVVKEAGTKYLRNSRQGDFAVGGNTLGVILETASGKKVGLRHTYEIWVQPVSYTHLIRRFYRYGVPGISG